MANVTLTLAILLGAGFTAAKLGQLLRLPSVTGYICAGLLLGPSGFNLIATGAGGNGLDHFNQLALMLISFGIGEHLELKQLRLTAKSVLGVGLASILGTLVFVIPGTFVVAWLTRVGGVTWNTVDYLMVAMLLGTIAVATAPATTLHVLRELRATGPMTLVLLPVVAVNDGFAIMLFGIAMSMAHHVVGSGIDTVPAAATASLVEIGGSLLLGAATGFVIDMVVNRLRHRSEMLTFGLALLLLCGEGARYFGFSPLLAGMAAGFVIINRDHRDVRLFRTLNAFEPPVYVLFFTLAGAQLDIAAMANAGWVGLVYFLLRSLGKMAGAGLGARFIAALPQVRRYLGLALVPQAGIAIGFILLIQGDQELARYASVIIPVVLAGVILSELVGPACIRMAVEKAGEALAEGEEPGLPVRAEHGAGEMIHGPEEPQILPWTWGDLVQADDAEGAVIFGASNAATVAGLARIATLIAHYHHARPLAVRVVSPGRETGAAGGRQETQVLFRIETAEVRRLGYDLDTTVIHAENVATGILAATCRSKTWGIVLGYPVKLPVPEFERVVEKVALAAPCPVIVVRFVGILHTERILVPLASSRELEIVRSTLCALAGVGRHRITLLRLLPPDTREQELAKARNLLTEWAGRHGLTTFVRCRAVATEARLETIAREGLSHDLLLMAAPRRQGLKRFFFGSLAEEVGRECLLPMILVHVPHPGERPVIGDR